MSNERSITLSTLRGVLYKRPIAIAALDLDLLCKHKDGKHSKHMWELAEFLFGKENIELWKKQGGKEKIREMLYKNLDVFQSADSTGDGFIHHLNDMYSAGEFIDESGVDFLKAALTSGDEEMIDNLIEMIVEKMGISKLVAVSCFVSFYSKKNGGDLSGRSANSNSSSY